jgi:methyl-accepting chemotaxis protein
MTNEDLQKFVEFAAAHLERLTGQVEQLADVVKTQGEQIAKLNGAFIGLFELARQNTNAIAELRAAVAELREQQAHTDDRINALIDIINRWPKREP